MPSSPTRPMPALHGIIPPLVTPLTADGELDEAGLANVVRRVIDGGVHGLFVLGTTGEWAGLDDATRRRVIDVCAHASAGRVPMYVHVTDTRMTASVALARFAADAGAAAIVVGAPYYLPLQQAELVDYANAMLDRQNLPVVLYNIPQFMKTRYDVETVAGLAENPRVIGVKDSSGDLAYQRQLIGLAESRPHFGVLCGDERYLVDMVGRGAHGCVGGGANLLPRLLVSLFNATVGGDAPAVETLHEQLRRLAALYEAPTVAGGMRNLKTALCQLGVIATDRMAEPYGGTARSARVQGVLHTLGLTVDTPANPTNGEYHAATRPS